MNQAVAAASDPLAELAASGMAYVEFGLANPGLFRLMFRPELTGLARARFLPPTRPPGTPWFAVIERCQAAGHSRTADPATLATLCWSTVHGVTTLWLDRPLQPAMAADPGEDARVGREVAERVVQLLNDLIARARPQNARGAGLCQQDTQPGRDDTRPDRASTQWWRGEGFEPSKAKPTDLQSAPIGRSGNPPMVLQQEYSRTRSTVEGVPWPTAVSTSSARSTAKRSTTPWNQAAKELSQRYDFKNTGTSIAWQGELGAEITSGTEERAVAALDVFRDKLVKRGVSLKALDAGEPRSSGKEYKINCSFASGITQEQAKKVRPSSSATKAPKASRRR